MTAPRLVRFISHVSFLAALVNLSFGQKYEVHNIASGLTENAYAVVRMSETTFDIENLQKATYKVRTVITVLNEKGAPWGEFAENYDKLDLISDIKITIYDKSGWVVKKVKSKEITDIGYTSSGSLYDDNRLKIFTPVDIEYPYTIETEVTKIKTPSLHYPEWNVRYGEHLAVEQASLKVSVPPNFELRFKPMNLNQKPIVSESRKGVRVYTWSLENVPAAEQEVSGPEIYQVGPRVLLAPSDFSMEGINGSMRTWREFGQWINGLNKDRDNLPDELKQEIKNLTEDLVSTREKTKAIYEYLQRNTRYVSIQLGIGGFQPMEASIVNENGYGDCKALTNFTHSLLKSIGIKSNYTLIKAGDNEDDILVDFPSQQFNHVILAVPIESDTVWLECTSQKAPFNFLGGFTSDRHALMITDSGGVLVKTPEYTGENNAQVRKALVTFDIDGNAKAEITTRLMGRQYDDNYFIMNANRQEQQTFVLNTIEIPVFDLKSFDYTEFRGEVPVLTQNLSLDLKRFGSKSGNRIFFTANLMNRSTQGSNAIEPKREFPILNRYAYMDVDSISYKLPIGYVPEYIPNNLEEISNFGKFQLDYAYDTDRKEILLVRRILINKGTYASSAAEDYVKFRKAIVRGDREKNNPFEKVPIVIFEIRNRNMLRCVALLMFCIGLITLAHGQDSTYVYGNVKKSDLEMKYYTQDSSANAVYILDKGYLGYGFYGFSFRYHGRIKLFNKESFEMANVSIPMGGREEVNGLRAMVHNLENGEIIKTELTDDDFVIEKIVKGLNTVTFTFPKVKEGSVLEYVYELRTSNPFEYLPWYFQSSIPSIESEFMFRAPSSTEFVPRIYGFEKLESYTKGIDGSMTFKMKHVPAFIEEPYVNNPQDFYSKLTLDYVLEQASSWEDLINIIIEWPEFGYTLDESSGVRRILPREASWSVDRQGLIDIHEFVSNRFKWNGQRGLMFSDVPRKVWKSDEISAADINLSLYMVLKKIGFDVEIVFLSTSDNGLINKEVPTFRQFNYVIVSVNFEGEEILMDATSPSHPYNVLPDHLINDEGLVIRGGKLRWVNLHQNGEFYSQATTVNFESDSEGKLTGHVSISNVNASAANIRTEFQGLQMDDFEKAFKEALPEFSVDSLRLSGLYDRNEPVKVNFDFSTEEFTETVGDRLFIRPVLFREIEENPFKLKERKLPIDFTLPTTERYFFSFEIPQGYGVEELPKAQSMVFPGNGGSYTYQIQKTETSVQVLVRVAIRRKQFFVEDYASIKDVFDLIVTKQEERIVLVKKENR